MRVYLDTCSLCRPFDDPSIDRNRLEAEAVLVILRHVHQGDWELIGSKAVSVELNAIGSREQRDWVGAFQAMSSVTVVVTESELTRMDQWEESGLAAMDALHVACAESAQCDVVLTTDDRFRKSCVRLAEALGVRVENPLTWITEQLAHGDD